MYSTNYVKASSVAEAAAALGDEAKLLAGGQTLIPSMKAHLAAPSSVVDISAMAELTGISQDSGTLTIGAATTHAEVAASDVVAAACPGLAALAGGIGDPAVRHRGTIGGSVANNDPAADYPAALLALGATIVTNTREIGAEAFFTGLFSTALEENEIITAIRVPAAAKSAYAKFPNPASRYALVGVFVAQGAGGTRVAVTGAGDDGVFRHSGLEAALASEFSEGAAAGVAISADGLMSDIHANADYRANLIGVMAKRAVAAAS